MESVVAVLDVGGTSIKSGVVRFDAGGGTDADVEIGRSFPARSDESADVVIGQLADATDAALELAGDGATGLAIGICGPFDIEAGISRMRGVHKFEDIYGVDLHAALRQRSAIGHRPIRFARDAESAGTGEALAGAGAGVARVLTVTVGTGLGTCLTDHARPVPIVDGFGVEHLGMRDTPWGRADDVLSAYGLAHRLGVTMEELPAAVRDPANADVVADHGSRLGLFLAPVVTELAAGLVVVGGGISVEFVRFGPCLQAALGDTEARPAALGAAAPLLGAAHLTFRS